MYVSTKSINELENQAHTIYKQLEAFGNVEHILHLARMYSDLMGAIHLKNVQLLMENVTEKKAMKPDLPEIIYGTGL